MKELNLHELLRYFSAGVFMTILLYFSIDDKVVKTFHEDFGGDGSSGIFIFIFFTFGSILYIINRATIYQFFIQKILILGRNTFSIYL